MLVCLIMFWPTKDKSCERYQQAEQGTCTISQSVVSDKVDDDAES